LMVKSGLVPVRAVSQRKVVVEPMVLPQLDRCKFHKVPISRAKF
jgi:hypothetical protein